jgi:hypothetical protein
LYQRAIAIYQETGNYYALSQTFLATSRVLTAAGQKQQAIEFLKRAEELSRYGVPAQHQEIMTRLEELQTASTTE